MIKYIFPELRGDTQTAIPVLYCSFCGCEIYDGEEFFHAGDKVGCVDCVWKDVAE